LHDLQVRCYFEVVEQIMQVGGLGDALGSVDGDFGSLAAPLLVVVMIAELALRGSTGSALRDAGFAVRCCGLQAIEHHLAAFARWLPRVVVVDATARGHEALVSAVRSAEAAPAVVAFGGSRDHDPLPILSQGACAWLPVEHFAALPQVVSLAAAGVSAIPASVLSSQLDHPHPARDGSERDVLLTARQREIRGLRERGMTTAQIARQLHVSPATVKNHLYNVGKRLGEPVRRGGGGLPSPAAARIAR
jgi:DNA-binding NarL/FixJ family response regulator